jgi:aspartate/glutamate racemase
MSPDLGPLALLGARGSLGTADVLARMQQFAASRFGAVAPADYPQVATWSALGTGLGYQQLEATDPASGLVTAAKALERFSPCLIGIVSVSAHPFLRTLADNLETELVDLVEALAAAAENRRRRYLLLTCRTSGTHLAAALDRRDVPYATLNETAQRHIDEILRLAGAGEVRSAGERLARTLLQRGDDDYDAVLVGCSELSVVLAEAQHHDHVPAVSCNQVLAEAMVERYYEHVGRPALDVLRDTLVLL